MLAFHFDDDTLLPTETATKNKAALYVVTSESVRDKHNSRSLDVLSCDLDSFRQAITRENHTLKRTLTDPRVPDGIVNAFSDNILHEAHISPISQTARLESSTIRQLFEATKATLHGWISRLREHNQNQFPEKMTAFRPKIAVHGKYGKPCPGCQTLVQRIRYTDRETIYYPRCQTNGKILADRSLARLLKKDWPKSIEELEQLDKAPPD